MLTSFYAKQAHHAPFVKLLFTVESQVIHASEIIQHDKYSADK